MGEGLAPQPDLWLAKVRSPSCKPKNHFGQQLCKLHKQFGRRFNKVDSQFKKRKRCFNQLNQTKNKAEPPVGVCNGNAATDTHAMSSTMIVSLHIGLTIVLGLTPLGISLHLGTDKVINSCQQVVTSLWKPSQPSTQLLRFISDSMPNHQTHH